MSMAIKYGLMKKARSAEPCDEHGKANCMACGGQVMAEGGEVGADDDADHDDLVGRIMKQRKGSTTADSESADYDVMDQLDPGTDADYTGANSGDEDGNAEMDENDRDLIDRIMRSRSKRDRTPRPA